MAVKPVTLAITYHDPDGRLYPQVHRHLPLLRSTFSGTAVMASDAAYPKTLGLLQEAGALVARDNGNTTVPVSRRLGKSRRRLLALALQQRARFIFSCDADRILHWAENYAAELQSVVRLLPDHDFTVLGRTARAWDSHPAMQRETEAIVNRVFAVVSGLRWDITAAARGLSRAAAGAIVQACQEESIGVDAAWPLFVQRRETFSLGYLETEGLEFETGDRHQPEIKAAGGYAAWQSRLDADPGRWLRRLEFARAEINAMLPYWESTE